LLDYSCSFCFVLFCLFVRKFIQAFVGGTVGVMGMAFIIELRKLQENSLEGCPYCMSSGEILCGQCLGNGKTSLGPGKQDCVCSLCAGRGLVICINCKGDGRNTPILLQSRATRDPEYATQGRVKELDIDSP